MNMRAISPARLTQTRPKSMRIAPIGVSFSLEDIQLPKNIPVDIAAIDITAEKGKVLLVRIIRILQLKHEC